MLPAVLYSTRQNVTTINPITYTCFLSLWPLKKRGSDDRQNVTVISPMTYTCCLLLCPLKTSKWRLRFLFVSVACDRYHHEGRGEVAERRTGNFERRLTRENCWHRCGEFHTFSIILAFGRSLEQRNPSGRPRGEPIRRTLSGLSLLDGRALDSPPPIQPYV